MKNGKRIPHKRLYLLLLSLMGGGEAYAETTKPIFTNKKQINLVNPTDAPIVLSVDNSSNDKTIEYNTVANGQTKTTSINFPQEIEIPAYSTVSILPGAQIQFYNYGNTGDNTWIYAPKGVYVTNNMTGSQKDYASVNNQWMGFYGDPSTAWNGYSDDYYLNAPNTSRTEVLNGNEEMYEASNLNEVSQEYADDNLSSKISPEEQATQYNDYILANPDAEFRMNLDPRTITGNSQNPFSPNNPTSSWATANETGDYGLSSNPDNVYLSGSQIAGVEQHNSSLNLANSETYYLSGTDLAYKPDNGEGSSVALQGGGTVHKTLAQTNFVNNTKNPITIYSVSNNDSMEKDIMFKNDNMTGGGVLFTLQPGETLVLPVGTSFEYSSLNHAYYVELPSNVKPYIFDNATGQTTYLGGYNQWYSVSVGGNNGELNWNPGQDEGVSFASAVDLETEYQQNMPSRDPNNFYDGTVYNANNTAVAYYNQDYSNAISNNVSNKDGATSYKTMANGKNQDAEKTGITYNGEYYSGTQVQVDYT